VSAACQDVVEESQKGKPRSLTPIRTQDSALRGHRGGSANQITWKERRAEGEYLNIPVLKPLHADILVW
jgi:hypothetical protein